MAGLHVQNRMNRAVINDEFVSLSIVALCL